MRKVYLLALGLLTGLCTEALDVVKDGQAVAAIVLPANANASAKNGAMDLQMFFKRISGAEVPIVEKPDGKITNAIYVGESEFTRECGFRLDAVKDGGYRVLVKDHIAIVAGRDALRKPFPYDRKNEGEWQKKCGYPFSVNYTGAISGQVIPSLGIRQNDDTGTWYATSDVLYQLGVRFYAPGERGTVTPSARDIILATQDKTVRPAFAKREYYHGYGGNTNPEFQTWLRRNGVGNSRVVFANHTLNAVLTPEFVEQHPDAQAKDAQGKPIFLRRQIAPKLTSPELRQAAIAYLRNVFDAMPKLEWFSLGLPDGFSESDHEDTTIKFPKKEKREARQSNYVWDFWSAIADELKTTHPDKKLLTMAYVPYQTPPDDPQLVRDNIAMVHCISTFNFVEPLYRKGQLETRQNWLKLLSPDSYMIWENYLYHHRERPRTPAFFHRLLQEDMQALNGKCVGKFIEVTSFLKFPELLHSMIYWQNMLLWNPDADLNQVMNEYFQLYYGAAAPEMKEFYDYATLVWEEKVPTFKVTAETLKKQNDRYFEILVAAQKKTEPGSVYAERIAALEKEMAPLKKQHEQLVRQGRTFGVYQAVSDPEFNGDFEDDFWNKPVSRWYPMTDWKTGKPVLLNYSSRVAFRWLNNPERLVVAVECREKNMAGLRKNVTKNKDREIFNDDNIEIFINTPVASYFRIAVNPNGAIYDETFDPGLIDRYTLPELWNSGAKAAVKLLEDRWVVEIEIPNIDFGKLGPNKDNLWGINVCRTRYAGGNVELSAFIPGGKSFGDTTHFANMWFINFKR